MLHVYPNVVSVMCRATDAVPGLVLVDAYGVPCFVMHTNHVSLPICGLLRQCWRSGNQRRAAGVSIVGTGYC